MSKKSKIILVVAVIALIATVVITEIVLNLIYFLKIDNSMSKEEINVMVNENKTKLDEIVDIILELNYEEIEKRESSFINKLNAKREINSIYKSVDSNGEVKYIYFSCGGKGWDYYCGFYYSPNDCPLIMGGNSEDLQSREKGWYANINGLDYYTERITDNYFYYEDIY